MELRGGGHLVTSVSSGLRLNETHLDEFNLLKNETSRLNCFSLCLLQMLSGHRGGGAGVKCWLPGKECFLS